MTYYAHSNEYFFEWDIELRYGFRRLFLHRNQHLLR